MLVAEALARRSHWRYKVATHFFAPNARPELTSCLYRLWTRLSSTWTCSTQVTWCRHQSFENEINLMQISIHIYIYWCTDREFKPLSIHLAFLGWDNQKVFFDKISEQKYSRVACPRRHQPLPKCHQHDAYSTSQNNSRELEPMEMVLGILLSSAKLQIHIQGELSWI